MEVDKISTESKAKVTAEQSLKVDFPFDLNNLFNL